MIVSAPREMTIDEPLDVPRPVMDRAFELIFAFTRAEVADPSIMEGMPTGVSLTLIPDDDPELAAYAIKGGVTSVQRGKNVYFLHVAHNPDGTLAIKRPTAKQGAGRG